MCKIIYRQLAGFRRPGWALLALVPQTVKELLAALFEDFLLCLPGYRSSFQGVCNLLEILF